VKARKYEEDKRNKVFKELFLKVLEEGKLRLKGNLYVIELNKPMMKMAYKYLKTMVDESSKPKQITKPNSSKESEPANETPKPIIFTL
jgi:hypothetical protein